jgi:hypothetical protein
VRWTGIGAVWRHWTVQRAGNLQAMLWRAGYEAPPDREGHATIDLTGRVGITADPPSEPA